jgi:signal transduction histidine kinase/ligand-binding sensor domain-containing protein
MSLSRFIFVGIAAALLELSVAARELDAASAAYLVDSWDTEKGLPSSTVTAIAQTPDGYLWVGTYNGLARFDGARFVPFDPVNTPALTQPRIQGLFLDANGTLWINTFRGGLTSYRNGVFRNEWPDQPTFDLHTTLVFSSSNQVTFVTQFGEVLQRDPARTNLNWKISEPPPGSRPIFQCVDGRGELWFLARDGRILQFSGGAFTELPDNGGLGTNRINTDGTGRLVADARGRVWVGAENEIARWDGSRFENMTPTNGDGHLQPLLLFPTRSSALWVLDGERFREMKGRRWVAEAMQWRGLLGPASGRAMGTHEDRDGGLWFNQYGNGLFHITPDGRYQRLTTADDLPGDRVGAWFQSSDGGIWVGVDHGGLARLRDRRFHVIGPAEGLPVRTALSVCEDASGAVWIGTGGGGLCDWDGEKLTRFNVGPSASADFVFSIFPRLDGGAWLSAGDGEDLYQFRDGQVQRAAWEVHGVKSILTDHAGRTWLGTKAGIDMWAGTNRWIFQTNETGLLPAFRALVETPKGAIWAGADDGALYRCTTNGVQAFRPKDALAEQPIYSLVADADGTLWAGTFRGGLLRFKDGEFTRFTARQGLPLDIISQMLEDNQGRLWLGTHQGIYCVAKSNLNACAAGKVERVDYVTYGRLDGLPTLEFSDGYQPACWRGASGRLWFTTVRGAVWFDPNQLTANSPPPPVLIEELRVDGEPVVLNHRKISVPPGRKQYEFRFTALNFDSPDKTRFRYRLDGVDTDWVDAGNQRTVRYGQLAPRDYRFRVIACNSRGAWNMDGASVEFTVRPYFYQTAWFRILAGISVLGIVAFTVRRVVTAKYRRRLVRLEQQHAIERDRTRIAKDIHDDIGAGLTQITLLTELARREPDQVGKHLERISGSARQLTRAMDEIVWAVDPQHDTFNGLMDYVSAYAEDFLRTAGIRCRMELPVTLPEARVDAELRYNLFLALKEALNNVVKHAKATEVWLRLRIEPKSFTLIIEDNGQGLSAERGVRKAEGGAPGANSELADRLASGFGLGNLEKRLSAVGGRCRIHSNAGLGTCVEMTVTLNHRASPVMAIGQDDFTD